MEAERAYSDEFEQRNNIDHQEEDEEEEEEVEEEEGRSRRKPDDLWPDIDSSELTDVKDNAFDAIFMQYLKSRHNTNFPSLRCTSLRFAFFFERHSC